MGQLEIGEDEVRELVACPECTAHAGEYCRNRDGSPCGQHPTRADAATLRASAVGTVTPAPAKGG